MADDALTRLRDMLGYGAASSLYAGGGDVQPGLNMLGHAVVAPALAGGAALEATMTGQPVSAAEMLQAAMMGVTPTPTRLPGGVPSATPTTMERLWADETGGIRAFHGSPHSFDRFDLSKIGTGEGAQAYGHGLYFAENEATAKMYRDQVKNMPLIDSINAKLSEIARERDKIRESGALFDQASPERQRFMDLATEYDRLMAEKMKPGHMYEVDINADPKAFLDWDRLLSEQPSVRNTIDPMLEHYSVAHSGKADPTGQQIYDAARGLVGSEYPGATKGYMPPSDFNPAALASQQLREAGIPGIRYLDQGSRGAGAGSSNYAIFDPNIIEIRRKYGLLPPLAGGGLLATQGPGDDQ